MASQFAFSFDGDDIDNGLDADPDVNLGVPQSTAPTPPSSSNTYNSYHQRKLLAAETGSLSRPSRTETSDSAKATAFPIEGQTQLPARAHSLQELLATLPDRIAFGTLDVRIDDGEDGVIGLRRRELWDVRVQSAAEDEVMDGAEGRGGGGKEGSGLGGWDVRTGVYEGGFKSWECSVDLVRVLGERRRGKGEKGKGRRFLEMGCGTALPSLAVLQWHLEEYFSWRDARKAVEDDREEGGQKEREDQMSELHIILADYNPTVLALVTVPNLLLVWDRYRERGPSVGGESGVTTDARVDQYQPTEDDEGEMAITTEVLTQFVGDLKAANVTLSLISGAWGPDFVNLLSSSGNGSEKKKAPDESALLELLILGAETIYSPYALRKFTDTLLGIMERNSKSRALVGSKEIYFGVGGDINTFIEGIRERGGLVEVVREEVEGIRRRTIEIELRDVQG